MYFLVDTRLAAGGESATDTYPTQKTKPSRQILVPPPLGPPPGWPQHALSLPACS